MVNAASIATNMNGCMETFHLNILLFLCLEALSCFIGLIMILLTQRDSHCSKFHKGFPACIEFSGGMIELIRL